MDAFGESKLLDKDYLKSQYFPLSCISLSLSRLVLTGVRVFAVNFDVFAEIEENAAAENRRRAAPPPPPPTAQLAVGLAAPTATV